MAYESNNAPQRPKLYCAQSKDPLEPGEDVYEVIFRQGIISQNYDFVQLEPPVRKFFASREDVHKYTSPKETYRYRMPVA